jgi:hypothetical protein
MQVPPHDDVHPAPAPAVPAVHAGGGRRPREGALCLPLLARRAVGRGAPRLVQGRTLARARPPPVVLRRRAVEPHMRQGVLRRRHRLPPRQGCAPAPLLIRNQRPDAPRAAAQDSWHTSSAASSSPSSSVPLPRRSAATSPRPRPRHRPHSPPSSAAAASRGPRSPRSTPATRSLPSSSPSCVPRPPLAPCASRAARRPRIPCIR